MQRRRAERWVVAVVVLLLHLLLLLAWRHVVAPTARTQPPTPSSDGVLLLLPMPREAATREAAPRPTAVRTPSRSAIPALGITTTPQATTPQPQAINVPLAAVPPTEPASSAAPVRLELALPRAPAATAQRSMREQMLNDPRANSPKPNVESRLAAVSGTTAMTEERMDENKARFRQNGQCIEVHVSHDAQTNPWNQNHSPTPKIVKPSC